MTERRDPEKVVREIKRKTKGKMVFEFTATSEPEVINWILSFGEEARLLAPPRLVDKLRGQLETVSAQYR